MVSRRRTLAIALALLLLVPSAEAARAEPAVYAFTLTYAQQCEGFAKGDLRVDGGRIELYGDAGGGDMQRIGSGILEPDGTFRIDVPEASFNVTGRVVDPQVTGEGSYTGLGAGCTFTLAGARVGPQGPPLVSSSTSTVVDEQKVEEFDPASDAGLSEAEVRGLLIRKGLDDAGIAHFFDQYERRTRDLSPQRLTPKQLAGLRGAALASGLAYIRSTDGSELLFPHLHGLAIPGGPLRAMAGVLRAPAPDDTALHRAVRLGIALGL